MLWLFANGFGLFVLVFIHYADKQEFVEDVTAFVSDGLEKDSSVVLVRVREVEIFEFLNLLLFFCVRLSVQQTLGT